MYYTKKLNKYLYMKKYKFLRISKTKKLRYIHNYCSKKLYVIFLPGFMSDIEGKKPQSFLRFALKQKIGFLTFEYSGHGKSSGKFTLGNISTWTKETSFMIKKFVKKNYFILIGSSMGAWIALNQFKNFGKQIKGFVGIGSAPEFLTRLMWNKFPKKLKKQLTSTGICQIESGKYKYPISYQLIKDGRKNKIFFKKFKHKIYLTMFHGKKDEVVPVIFSKKILRIFKRAKKKLIIIKKGDHSLYSVRSLKMIQNELKRIVKNIS